MGVRIERGGILAAGLGSRLKGHGLAIHKPAVEVAGVPLLERVIANFRAAGIRSLVVIVNEDEAELPAAFAARCPDMQLTFHVETTPSSLVSFERVVSRLGPGPCVLSTVDAVCRPEDFVRFVAEAGNALRESGVALGVTSFVADEKPLWVHFEDGQGEPGKGRRVLRLGGDGASSSFASFVTAGVYALSERARARQIPGGLGRLREYLGWLVAQGEPVSGVEMGKVIDVDRPEDVAMAEAFLAAREPVPACGIYRERAHSPGRETDDEAILRLTGERLSELGFAVAMRTPEELDLETPPAPFLFVMCERLERLDTLAAWERMGTLQVNGVEGILNTYRDRTLARFAEAAIPFPTSGLVRTSEVAATSKPACPLESVDDVLARLSFATGIWVKRGDVHNTQAGDVVWTEDRESLDAALALMASRGIPFAVLQEHVPGDLIKFYGIGRRGEPELYKSGVPNGLPWFEFFYHKNQTVAGHPFDREELAEVASRAARALGLEVFGGDAIAAADGRLVLIDLNAWPSFALYREAASRRIAAHLAARFSGTQTAIETRLAPGLADSPSLALARA